MEKVERIMVDTSAIYALLDRTDNMHPRARSLLRQLGDQQVPVLLTNFIVAECHALIARRLGPALARAWLKNLVWPVERVSEDDEYRARQIIISHEDKSFSYTDATTFALMERLGIGTTFAFDRHFAQYGFQVFTGTAP